MITYRMLIVYYSIVSVESGAIHEQSINIDTIFGSLLNVLWVFCVHHLKAELKPINCNFVLSSVCL